MLSAEPVCSCACSYAHLARETAGAARTRLSLRPLFDGGADNDANLGRTTPRECERMVDHRHCERSEAIHLAAQRKDGLLRCARNDVDKPVPPRSSSPRLTGRPVLQRRCWK